MKKLLALLFLIPSIAHAQYDKPCGPDDDSYEDKCIPGRDTIFQGDATFFGLYLTYNFCKTGLIEQELLPYSSCVDGAYLLKGILSDPSPLFVRYDLLALYRNIPPLAVIEKPGDYMNALNEIAACEASRRDASGAVQACINTRAELASAVASAANKPPPPAPRCRRR